MLRTLPIRALLLVSAAALATACGSQTIRANGGARDAQPTPDVADEFALPDAADDFPAPPDLPPPPDVFDEFPPPPDRPVPFDIFTDPLPPPPDAAGNTSCAAATFLPPGTDVLASASIADATQRIAACGTSTVVGAGVRYFRTTVPPGETLEVAAQRSSFAPLLRLYPDCTLGACLAQGLTPDGTNYITRWNNPGPAPRDVVIAVTWNTTAAAPPPLPFQVRFRRPAANATCATATPLRPGVAVTGQDLADATTASPACPEAPGTSNPALWYRVAVPPGQVLTVTSVGDIARAGNILRLYGACGAFTCLAGPSVSSDARTATIRWSNGSTAPRDVLVAVSAPFTGTPAAPFALTATLSPAPTNLTCDRAVDVADGTTLPAQDVSGASILQPPCPGMAGAALPVLFYRATVPPGQTLFASATPSAGMTARATPVLRVVPDCSLTTCLAASTAVAAGQATVAWTNPSTTPQRVVITMGANPTASAVPTDLTFRIRPPAANASCMTPLRVMDGTSLPGENLTEARELARACSTTGVEGPVLYYAARVGAGQQLVATSARVDGAPFQPLLPLTDGCASLTCLVASTLVAGPTGATARLVYTNDGPARDVVLMLSSASGAAGGGRASLNVAISSPPYAISRVPTACEDLSTGPVVAEAVGDDTGSPSLPLPFVFPHFGERMSAWSASTNGYLQVWPMAGRSGGALGVTDFPNASAPPSAIAAFWDDLEVRSPAEVRWRFVAAAPRHLTVGWNRVGFCCGGSTPGELTFQVKLFESGAVEYHYCALTPGLPRAAGGNAAIGMQNSTALRGVNFALRRAGAADTASAIRFTPAP